MRDLPENLKFRSEVLEPTFEHMIGKWFAQAEYMKKTYGPHSAAYVDALQDWWWGLLALNRVLIVCQGAIHAQLAMGNTMRDVKYAIEKELKISWSFTDGGKVQFRQLVPFDLEFPEFKNHATATR